MKKIEIYKCGHCGENVSSLEWEEHEGQCPKCGASAHGYKNAA